MQQDNITYRTIHYDLKNIITSQEYTKIENAFDFLEKQLHKLIYDYTQTPPQNPYTKQLLKSKDKFRNQTLDNYGYRNKQWNTKGNNAKNYRIIIERFRQILLSQYERKEINTICAKHNYDIKQLNKIREDLNQHKLYPTTGNLKNIITAKGKLSLPKTPKFIYDYTTEDNQISTIQYLENHKILIQIKIENDWIPIIIKLPHHAHTTDGTICKPIIQKDDNNTLYMRIAYKVAPLLPDKTIQDVQKPRMGIDAGRTKPFAASINYNDTTCSTELTMSRELEHNWEKIKRLEKNKKDLYEKIKQNTILLETADYQSFWLSNKLKRQIDEKQNVSTSLTKLKEHCEWLIARDIVNHCIFYNIDTIHVEDLKWLESKGGKWNFSSIQECLHEVAQLHGISLYVINARNTSQVDPFDNSKPTTHPEYNRTVTKIGVLDRDYVSSGEVALRPGRLYDKKDGKHVPSRTEKLVSPKRVRDKHVPTPKRPKQPSRKRLYKLGVKECFKKRNTGCYITVDISGEPTKNLCSWNSLSKYKKYKIYKYIDDYHDILII